MLMTLPYYNNAHILHSKLVDLPNKAALMPLRHLQLRDVSSDLSKPSDNELLATKLMVPSPPHVLIARPRLSALLNEGLQRKLTLLSAPAGFGKTTLLSTWVRSRPEQDAPVAWVSLDESDNDPVRFWSYLLTALNTSYQGIGKPALAHLSLDGSRGQYGTGSSSSLRRPFVRGHISVLPMPEACSSLPN